MPALILSRTVCAALGALAALLAAKSLYLGITLARPMPNVDYWVFVELDLFAYLDGRYSIADLFRQVQEHRILTTRLVLFADALLDQMRGTIPIAVSYAVLAAIAATITVLLKVADALERVTVFLCALAALWSTCQFINLSSQFQVQFPFVHLFALLCYCALGAAIAAQEPRTRAIDLSAAIVADFLAVYSIGSGVLVVVPAVAIAVWMRRGAKLTAIFCAAHVAILALYFYGYHRPDDQIYGANTFAHALDMLSAELGLAFGVAAPDWDYFANSILPKIGVSFFESSWPSATMVVMGEIGATVFVAVTVALTSAALLWRRAVDQSTAVLIALASFTILETAVTAVARTGTANRYATVSVVFWTALLAALWRSRTLLPGKSVQLSSTILAVSILLLMVEANREPWNVEWRKHIAAIDQATAEAMRGPLTGENAAYVAGPLDVAADLERLRKLKLGPFAPGYF